MILTPSLFQVSLAFFFLIVTLLILRMRKINREKELIVASLRMTLQLILTGYVLIYLFENPHPLLSLAVIFLMTVFAIRNIYARVQLPLSRSLKRIIAFSMASGSIFTVFFFILLVLGVKPWFDPQYLIPIGGMLIGNAMTGISLGVTRLSAGMEDNRHIIETALMLGATPRAATKEIVDHAFDSAILPTINSMVGMGIVFLPGMMTGQILSGISPITAIEYQLIIMLGILGSVSITTILFVELGYKTFFNKDQQLIFSPTD
ncbi:MAG: hypothetical protein AVO33_04395 [delta proteobacterium ML8_F1]|nr:MAG: hypothetical protein AVO33_04395 [delta proteobacterium ML8_F1]